jgi:hypothetical protein
MKKLLFLTTLFSSLAFGTPAGDLNLTPTSLKLKVFKMAVSASGLCTNLITIIDNGSTPAEVDFTQDPSLGAGSVADGTYPCIVIEFADAVKFTPPNSASLACLSSVEETLDVCRTPDTSVLIDGTSTSCGAPGTTDRVAMYISTFSIGGGSDAFNAPTSNGDALRGLNLGAALTIAGTAAGKFTVNPAGQVCDDSNDTGSDCEGGGASASCQMGPPAFSFSAI